LRLSILVRLAISFQTGPPSATCYDNWVGRAYQCIIRTTSRRRVVVVRVIGRRGMIFVYVRIKHVAYPEVRLTGDPYSLMATVLT
jgi:hypothetical protein